MLIMLNTAVEFLLCNAVVSGAAKRKTSAKIKTERKSKQKAVRLSSVPLESEEVAAGKRLHFPVSHCCSPASFCFHVLVCVRCMIESLLLYELIMVIAALLAA